jgi:hypothetical protein
MEASMSDVERIAKKLDNARRKAIMTRDGMGEYSTISFKKLLALGLVDDTFRYTDLGHSVRDYLKGNQ